MSAKVDLLFTKQLFLEKLLILSTFIYLIGKINLKYLLHNLNSNPRIIIQCYFAINNLHS
jgi:hypothetical protein